MDNSRIKKRNICISIIYMILLYMVGTLLQGIIPFSLNRVASFGIIVSVLIDFSNRIEKINVLLFLYLFFIGIFTSLLSLETSLNIQDYLYYTSAILLLCFFAQNENIEAFIEELVNKNKIIKKVIYLCFLIVIVSLFFSSNYGISWSDTYFYGFTRNSHAFASSLCLLEAFFLLIYNKEELSYIKVGVFISLLSIIFMTGARTFIVPSVIIAFFYIKHNLNSQIKKLSISIMSLFIMIYIFLKSNMMNKFLWSSNAKNTYASSSLESSSGGRIVFWNIDIQEFFKYNIFYKLFGHGFDFPYITNQKYYHMHIWSHNDLIDLILSVGLVGTVIYCFVWGRFIVNNGKIIKNKSIIMLLTVYVLFPLMVNGMFTYQHLFLSVIITVASMCQINCNIKNNEKCM